MNSFTFSEVQSEICRILADEILAELYEKLNKKRHVYLIVDNSASDCDLLESQILRVLSSNYGDPYVIDYGKIGSLTTFAQSLIPLIFLHSEFSTDLIKRDNKSKPAKIIARWLHGKTSAISILCQKFLECRECSSKELRKLEVNNDLSIEDDAIDFLSSSIEAYAGVPPKAAVFYLKNVKPSLPQLANIESTRRFLREVEHLSCVLAMIFPKQIEYKLSPFWDEFEYANIKPVSFSSIPNLVKRLSECRKLELHLDEEACEQFSRSMRYLHGNSIPGSALMTAVSDLIGFKRLENIDKVEAEHIRRFFSTTKTQVAGPKPRNPAESKSPYFSNEFERMTRECEAMGLDPHTALPYYFRDVSWHIQNGDIAYNEREDAFRCLRYLDYNYFRELSRSLYKMGYKYVVGSRQWVFSPSK